MGKVSAASTYNNKSVAATDDIIHDLDDYRARRRQAKEAPHGKASVRKNTRKDSKRAGLSAVETRRDLKAYTRSPHMTRLSKRPVSEFVAVNKQYEKWLKERCDLVKSDLHHKHHRMTKNAFVFLRATFYRWATQIETKCPNLKTAPQVHAVGDLHTENFGVWRDADGRLVWGINDFDDADTMPYVYDLVRLTTSAALAGRSLNQAAAAILHGYQRGLEKPRPTLVLQTARWMLPLIRSSGENFYPDLSDPEKCPLATPPDKVVRALRKSLPSHTSSPEFRARLKVGGGGLGRPRYVAIADWQGGLVVREAKAWVPSAWSWAKGRATKPKVFLSEARGANRSPDPILDVRSHFIIRRLAADSQKIDLGDDPSANLTESVLDAMGFETAAIHATNPAAVEALERDLIERPKHWLVDAAKTMRAAVEEDHRSWVEFQKG